MFTYYLGFSVAATFADIRIAQRRPDIAHLGQPPKYVAPAANDQCGAPVGRPGRELAYPAPAYAGDYTAAFDCDVAFGCERNRVLIDASWLASPMPAHNPISAQQVTSLCDAQMPGDRTTSEIVAIVERLLQSRLADNPRLVDIAADLHMSERTLRRHLRAAQTSFTALHDRIRSESARRLLVESRLSIAQIRLAVGFRDAREFRRAFKRWSGVTPHSVRP